METTYLFFGTSAAAADATEEEEATQFKLTEESRYKICQNEPLNGFVGGRWWRCQHSVLSHYKTLFSILAVVE